MNIDLSQWESWLVLVAGCSASFVIGLLVGRGRTQRARPRSHSAPFKLQKPLLSPRGAEPKENRKGVRRPGNPVEVFISGAEAETSRGKVLDRSQGGMRLEVNRAVSEGKVLLVRSSLAPEDVPWIQLEVKFCRKIKASWEVGCQFVGTPDWSALLLFG